MPKLKSKIQFLAYLLLVIPVTTMAATYTRKEINLNDPQLGFNLMNSGISSLPSLIKTMITGFSGLVASFSIISILYGAFLYITSMGNDEQLNKAKQFITYPILGLIIAACAFLIVQVVTMLFYPNSYIPPATT